MKAGRTRSWLAGISLLACGASSATAQADAVQVIRDGEALVVTVTAAADGIDVYEDGGLLRPSGSRRPA